MGFLRVAQYRVHMELSKDYFMLLEVLPLDILSQNDCQSRPLVLLMIIKCIPNIGALMDQKLFLFILPLGKRFEESLIKKYNKESL